MPLVEHQRHAFQFGAFELSPHTRELRKNGVKLKLQDQPLQILLLLLERSGELVTRDEIQRRLWPENTYVDFDNAINSAVRKLRDTLAEAADNPRFIETIARRGYRFVAPVIAPVPVQLVSRPARDRTEAPFPMHKPGWVLFAVVVVVAIGAGLLYNTYFEVPVGRKVGMSDIEAWSVLRPSAAQQYTIPKPSLHITQGRTAVAEPLGRLLSSRSRSVRNR
jgi:DNA-binding winged helix-turn-helix (wHTH) protein